jgi:hypothetical protein
MVGFRAMPSPHTRFHGRSLAALALACALALGVLPGARARAAGNAGLTPASPPSSRFT